MTYFNSPIISDWQNQIILGTILGGSTIVTPPKGINSYLFMRSSDKEWIHYKASELVELASQKPITKDGNTLRWHSSCFPVFNQYKEAFYDANKEKKVSMEILDGLRDMALAIWFGDCGKIDNGRVVINTCKFKENGSNIISQYFNEVGIKAIVFTERNNYRVRLSEAGTEKFLMTIGHRLPEFMHKKFN